VVGVTVAGTYRLTQEEMPVDLKDSFFQFNLPKRGDEVPIRSEG
jgi:hypothetical protein